MSKQSNHQLQRSAKQPAPAELCVVRGAVQCRSTNKVV